MAYSTVQKIREEAGLQIRYKRQMLLANGSSTSWKVDTDDQFKIVVSTDSGGTVPAVTDVVIEANGASIGVSAINQTTGVVTLAAGTSSGATPIADYASSPISDLQVYNRMQEANSIVNGYLSGRYTLPLSVTVPMLTDLETKLAAGNLLKASYGRSSEELAQDGYALQQDALALLEKIRDGTIDLVDSTGTAVAERSEESGSTDVSSSSNSRTTGWLFTPEDEKFAVTDPSDIRPTG